MIAHLRYKVTDASTENESLEGTILFLDGQYIGSGSGKDNLSTNYLRPEQDKNQCKDALHLSLEYATMKKKRTLTARLVTLFQKLKLKEKETSYQLYCLTL